MWPNPRIVAIGIGAAMVFFLFPRREDEQSLLAQYHAEDADRRG
jgi:DHA2 family multidrug resistance protein-like MFS transporter